MPLADARGEAWRRIVDPAIAFVLIAVLWEKAVDLFHVKAYLLPPLSKVLQTAWASRAGLAPSDMDVIVASPSLISAALTMPTVEAIGSSFEI